MTRRKTAPQPKTRIKTQTLPLTDLVPRPQRANAMTGRARRALAEHICRTGRYPALIVRPHPRRRGKYEILDGCARAEILAGFGRGTARCEIWPVDAAEAMILTGTLNHLRGHPDARSRARHTRRLARRLGTAGALTALGLTPAALRQQLTLLDRPAPAAPCDRTLNLQHLAFHLPPGDFTFVTQALRDAALPGQTRAQALVHALRAGGG